MTRPAPARASGIIAHFTRHRTLANLLMVLLLLGGLLAGSKIRTQYFPDDITGVVNVRVVWSGAGPEDIDRAIVQVLEPALQTVEGVSGTTAQSREGSATVSVTFEPDWDMGRATEEVQAAVDSVRLLPAEAERPEVSRQVWRDRVTDVVISGPLDPSQLARLVDELAEKLFAAGITRTTIQGIAAPEILVEVPTPALMRHNLTLRNIAEAIAAEAQSSPAGDIAGGATRIRTGTARRDAESIAAIVLRRGADGSTLTIGDVARVERLAEDRNVAFIVEGQPAMVLRVDRAEAGDAIAMQDTVQKAADALQLTVPQGVKVELIRTRAEGISQRLWLLVENGATGLVMVLALLFLFLNARTAIWVAAGIPVAMAAAVAVMYVGGLTVNMMTLFALIIMLGIVVDDAIIVGEHADYRARTLKEPPAEAAANAAIRMLSPVMAATLTTVLAFGALFAVGGSFGAMITVIPFTVAAVMIASLIECFLILPNHMAHAVASTGRDRWYDWPSRQFNRLFDRFRLGPFRWFMTWIVRLRYPVLALAILLLASQVALVIRGTVPWQFFSSPEQGTVNANVSMLHGSSRDDTMAMVRELQRATETTAARFEDKYGVNPVRHVLGQVGGNSGRGLASAEVKDPELLGSIAIELIDPDLRPFSSFEFQQAVEAEIVRQPKVEELSFRGMRFGPGGDSLSVWLSGAEADQLKAAAEALKTRLGAWSIVSGLEDSLSYDKQELVLHLTPQGQALGFSVDSLGRALRERLNGITAASYPEGTRSADIKVELPEAELTADFLDSSWMQAPGGAWLPLADLVTVETRAGFSTVFRENGIRLITVSGEIAEDDAQAATELRDALTGSILPAIAEEFGVSWQQGGLAEQEREFFSDALLGLMLCLTGIYLVLCWIFASWTRPLVVMSIIPFGLVGAIWGHWFWGMPMSLFSVVGMIGMAGIIINDSIVLVDATDELARDRPLHRAIVDGAADRARAVLLTTVTTVFGLAPLLYETSSQALFLKPTVITLVFGLGFGLVLVLMVVPALIAVQDDALRALQTLRRAIGPRMRNRAVLAALGGMLALFAVTMIWTAVAGQMPAPLTWALPGLPPMLAAALVFVAAVLLMLAGFAMAARVTGTGSR